MRAANNLIESYIESSRASILTKDWICPLCSSNEFFVPRGTFQERRLPSSEGGSDDKVELMTRKIKRM